MIARSNSANTCAILEGVTLGTALAGTLTGLGHDYSLRYESLLIEHYNPLALFAFCGICLLKDEPKSAIYPLLCQMGVKPSQRRTLRVL